MRLRVTLQAEIDLAELADRIANDDPQAALSILELIEQKSRLLCDYPELGRQRDELASGLRSFPANSYVIFYRIAADELQIIRVLHGARDVQAELQ
ncbi:MAG: type II toxin-antitoxin system RelE/ParE family toxin [Verrucomicrobiota bacterium]